jgi:excisionase family DNA binding protein
LVVAVKFVKSFAQRITIVPTRHDVFKRTEGPRSIERLTTPEVAELLRISARTVYHLVSRGQIPHTRANGKLLFERHRLEAWLAAGRTGHSDDTDRSLPETLAGSHDPLLDWAVRQSRCGLALAAYGSSDGLARVASGRASAALLHLPDRHGDGFNLERLKESVDKLPVVAVQWARREQGLIVARGNPLKIHGLPDLGRRRIRFAMRQPGAGSNLLFAKLMRRERVPMENLRAVDPPASSESEVADLVAGGYADAGFAIRAAANRVGLGFVPVTWETVDLLVWRRAWFEPALQSLVAFAGSRRFAAHARQIGGYDLTDAGQVRFNA